MSAAFFELLDDGAAGDGTLRYRSLEACVGPWSDDAMHGGPPSALLVRACEQAAGGRGTPAPLAAVRASVDFLSGVPVGDVEVAARVVRPGRRIALAEATLTAAGRTVLAARTWLLATSDSDPGVEPAAGRDHDDHDGVPGPADAAPFDGWQFPYARALEWRLAAGDPVGPGDAAVWARPRIPVVPGEDPSGLQRAVLVADSTNGVSARLDWGRWLFVNVDLDVHLSRPVVGDWLRLDATSRYERTGTGLATGRLHDVAGAVGRSAQTLVVTPR